MTPAMPARVKETLVLTPIPMAAVGASPAGAIFIDAPDGVSWTAEPTTDWVHPAEGVAARGKGPGVFTFSVDTNPGDEREGGISIVRDDTKTSVVHPLRQQAGASIREQSEQVLDFPWITVPRVMEIGIAAKWAAAQIKKIPEPFDLIALVIVEILVVVLGFSLIAARALIAPLVPEPPTPFPWPPMPSHSAIIPPMPVPLPPEVQAALPVTTTLIAMQTAATAFYIALQTLE